MKPNEHSNNKDSSEIGHQPNEVHLGGVTWFIVSLTIAVVFIAWLMTAMINTLEGREKKAEIASKPSPFAAERSKLPPEPRLQLAPDSDEQIKEKKPPDLKTQAPMQEMKELTDEWTGELKHYGWVDEKSGIVRIPIDDAKRLLLQRGLPTRPVKK